MFLSKYINTWADHQPSNVHKQCDIFETSKSYYWEKKHFSSDFNYKLEIEYMDPLNFKMAFDLILYEDKIFQFSWRNHWWGFSKWDKYCTCGFIIVCKISILMDFVSKGEPQTQMLNKIQMFSRLVCRLWDTTKSNIHKIQCFLKSWKLIHVPMKHKWNQKITLKIASFFQYHKNFIKILYFHRIVTYMKIFWIF